jgi:hypothetical protein
MARGGADVPHVVEQHIMRLRRPRR